MKLRKLVRHALSGLRGLTVILFVLQPLLAGAALEQTFDMLQIGTTTYRNVTVTTKSKSYVFLLHSRGMTNIKVSDMPADLKLKLGYDVPPTAQASPSNPSAWARQTLSKIEDPKVKQLETGLINWCQHELGSRVTLPPITRNFILIGCAVLLLLYLFHSYCCLLICQKAGSDPGALVWIPLLQLLPLLKAAGMSPAWFLAFLVPGLNLVAQVLWCVKITQARSKTILVALLLIFPLSSPFAALFLAFSGTPRAKKDVRRVEIMTLEAA